MALIRGKIIFEVTFEDLPVPLNHYAQLVIHQMCAQQVYYNRPWSTEEDKKQRRPNVQVKVIRPKANSNE